MGLNKCLGFLLYAGDVNFKRNIWEHPSVRKIFWKRKWQPAPVVLLGKSHGQRSLAGCSLWSCKKSDTTKHAHTHAHTHTHTQMGGRAGDGEGEGRSKRTLWFLVPVTMWVLCSITQSSPTLFGPMDCSLPGSSVLGGSPGKNTGVGCPVAPPSGDLPNPGIETRSPTLQADSLPSELSGKPKNTGEGSPRPCGCWSHSVRNNAQRKDMVGRGGDTLG